jgi:hypothetical protein
MRKWCDAGYRFLYTVKLQLTGFGEIGKLQLTCFPNTVKLELSGNRTSGGKSLSSHFGEMIEERANIPSLPWLGGVFQGYSGQWTVISSQ